MKSVLTILVLAFSAMGFAQSPREIPEYTHQGNLVSVRIVPKDRTAKIFLVGHKAAEVNLKDEAKVLSVTLLKKNQKEVLQLDKQGDYYEVKGLPAGRQPYDLMIQTEVRGQAEHLKVEVHPQKP